MLLFSDDILRGTKLMGVGLRPGHRSKGLNRFTVAITLDSMGQTWSQCSAGIFFVVVLFLLKSNIPSINTLKYTRVKKRCFFATGVFFANFKE